MKKSILAVFTVMALLLAASVASAQVSLIIDRATLAGDDYVDWAVLGSNGTFVPQPLVVQSNSGMIDVTASMPNLSDFQRLNQGAGWGGNFAPGDSLLFSNSQPDPIVLAFNPPVMGAGAQIQSNIGGAFNATINVYDPSNVLIGTWIVPGNSDGNADNSAIFVGAVSTTANIARIEYVTDLSGAGHAINQLDIVTGAASTVPTMNEWGMMIFFLLAGVASIIYLRKRSIA